MDLLQIATGITKCDDYYKLRQYRQDQLETYSIKTKQKVSKGDNQLKKRTRPNKNNSELMAEILSKR